MAPRSQSDLVRIGMEGFSLIDEYLGRKPSSSSANYKPKVSSNIYRYNYYPPSQESYYYQPQEPNKVVRVTNRSSSTYTTNEQAIVTMREKAATPQMFHELSYY